MSSILENYPLEKSDKHSKLVRFFRQVGLSQVLFACNGCKTKGYSALVVFIYFFELLFRRLTVYYIDINKKNDDKELDKNTVYRLIYNPKILWEKLLLTIGLKIIFIIDKLKTEKHYSCIIFDQTIYNRSKAKKTELMARIYDHCEKKYGKGYMLHTCAWSDGNTEVPLIGTLLSSRKDENVIVPASKTNPGTQEHERRLLARKSEPDAVLRDLQELSSHDIPAQYVLFDSWYTFPSLIYRIVNNFKYNVISRLKNNKTKYLYNNRRITLRQLYSESKKRRGRSKYLLSINAKMIYDDNFVDIKIVFIRNRYNKNDYIMLMSTDVSLCEEDIIKLYSRRWNIETMFKVCKSMLRLESGTQSTSYDALTAYITITFLRYMFLSYLKRQDDDPRTLGALFFDAYGDLQGVTTEEACELILTLYLINMKKILIESNLTTEEKADEIIENLNYITRACMQKLCHNIASDLSSPFEGLSCTNPLLSNS